MSIAERLGGFIMVNISRRNVLISTAFAGMTGLSGTASAAAARAVLRCRKNGITKPTL